MHVTCVVVEDSAFIREIYYFSLRELPHIHIIGEAEDGNKAIEMIQKLKPDFIILDIVLPFKDGFEILNQLPSISPQTKTLVISSLDEAAYISKAKALGAVEYLKKPFTKKQLLDVINRVSQMYSEVENG